MKFVADSSTLIALAQTGTLDALDFLKQKAAARFFIPPAVAYETTEHPEQIQRFAFSAYKIDKAVQQGVLERFPPKRPPLKTQAVLQWANSVFSVNGVPLKVLQAGEAEALATYADLPAAAILVDEKTTRLFIENPSLLQQSLQQEYNRPVRVNEEALSQLRALLSGMQVVRSSEILAVAFEKGFFDGYGKKAADAFAASLYAVRNAGCSITTRELLEYQELRKTA